MNQLTHVASILFEMVQVTMEQQALTQLTTNIENAIVHNPHFNHRKMHLKLKKGHVVLEGQVSTYFEKQMAQEALKSVSGVETVQNQLQVET